MFLRQIDIELMDDFLGTALDLCEKGSITVNDNEPKRRFTFKNGSKLMGLESSFARIDTHIDGFERFEINHKLLISFSVFVDEIISAEKDETLGGTFTV